MVSAALSTLNRAQYSGLDFDTNFDDALARMQVQFAADFNDFALSSLGIVLLDENAFGLDTLSFYLDRRATDTYLQTARTRGAVSRLTRQLGYKMGAAIASSVDLNVAISSPVPFPVPIPQGFQFLGPNSLIFETSKPITFLANSGLNAPQIIPCYEGETVVETFVSDGTPDQVFQLTRVPSGKSIAQGTVTVLVNGSPFTEVDFLEFETSDIFEFAANDDPPTIRFGDGVAGNIPTNNATIQVTYVATSGTAGLVLKNTITATVTPLVVGFQTIQLSIDNPSPSVGGSDQESLDHAKAFAPLVFKTRDVAVTQQDYTSLAGAFADPLFGRVAVAQALSSRSAADDLDLQNLLSSINAAAAGPKPTIDAAVAQAQTDTGTITTQRGLITNDLTATGVLSTNANNAVQTASSSATSSLGDVTALGVANTTNGSTASSVKTSVSATNTPPAVSQTGSLVFNQTARTISRQNGAWDADGIVAGMKVRIGNTGSNNGTYSIQSAVGQVITCAVGTVLTNETATAGIATVDIPDNDRLSTASKATYSAQMDTISSGVTSISSSASSLQTALNGIVTALAQASAALNSIGLTVTTPGSKLLSISTENTAIGTANADIIAQLTTLSTAYTDDIVNEIATLSGEVEDHVDQILSADCKANLISVPILSVDATGFYAAPSIGLIQALQTFLIARKEVTQTVVVTSGANFLVGAVVLVNVGSLKGFAVSAIQAAVSAAVDGVLRARAFGATLYVSELNDAVKSVQGVSYYNVSILGYLGTDGTTVLTDKLDTQGNLTVTEGQIVTKGKATINVTPAPSSAPNQS